MNPSPSPQPQNPNVVFILVDNVGLSQFGIYGGTIPTPRIDKLAHEGIRFNDYNVEVQCTPSRSAIMTGRHPPRSGTYKIPMPGQGKAGLCPWEYTIAELLSDAGYATALYGKWHLGDTQGRLPNDQGFDEWWGCMNSWDECGYTAYPLFKESGVPEPMIWEGVKGQPSKPAMPLDLNVRPIVDEKYIVPKTIEYIKKNASAKKPFFVYVGYSELHMPMMPNPNFANKSTERSGHIADCIAEMDVRVGQILDAVKEAGVEDNTIFILSSDNATGGCTPQDGGRANGTWRGDFFYTPFEGSMRVPAMIRWPGKVPAGVVTEQRLAAVDWLPTLAGIVGASNLVPKDQSQLAQLGLVGYDQWQVSDNGGNYLVAGLPVAASRIPHYSVHAIGVQANYLVPAKDVVLYFKYYDEYSAKARVQGRTIVFGGSWTWKIPKPAPPKK